MNRIYVIMLTLLAVGLVSGCSDGYDEEISKNCLPDEEESEHDTFMGYYIGEWSMVDAEGKTVPAWQDDYRRTLSGLVQPENTEDFLTEKVFVTVEPSSDNPMNRKITVRKMPVWMINQWLQVVNTVLGPLIVESASPEHTLTNDFSCYFKGELNGVSSGKYVYDLSLGERFAFVCNKLSSSFSFDQEIQVDCTFTKTSQCLYNLLYDTMDLYLPIESIVLDNSVDQQELKFKGQYFTLVLHAEKLR